MDPAYDLVISGGTVVTGRDQRPVTLAIRAGRIAGVLEPSERPVAAERVDATGLCVLPGIIDTHVHFRDPGDPEREDFASGTSAAASGGVTTVLEMPISDPPVNSAETLNQRSRQIRPRAIVDYALYGGVGSENPDQIHLLAEAGAVAFKTFLYTPAPGREREFTGLWCTDEGVLLELISEVAKTGLLHCFHCENDAILRRLDRRYRTGHPNGGLVHAMSRPPLVEDTAVAMLLALAEAVGARVQIVHMSSPRAARLVREAKARGVRATAETCPQYLFLTEESLREHGPYAKCNPALREATCVARLWSYLLNGTIDVMGSDHAPFLATEKEAGERDIFSAPAGMPGVDVMLPLMMNAVNEGRLTLSTLVRLMSERAAEMFQLPGKGSIQVGSDADLTLIDMNAGWTFDMDSSFSKAGNTMRPYHGRKLRGRVVSTFVRGQRVYEDRSITAEPGHGRFIRPIHHLTSGDEVA